MLMVVGVFAFAGCAGNDSDPGDVDTMDTGIGQEPPMQTERTATAALEPTEGNDVTGTVTFTALNGEVRVEGDFQNLAPGSHGFHIHETGDCSGPDASSAGDHFNPTDDPHGGPGDAERHVGDLGNIEAGSDSTATFSLTDQVITLDGPDGIVGKAVIVHSGEDDLETQPTGDAGDRLACGVIEADAGGPGAPMGPGAAPMDEGAPVDGAEPMDQQDAPLD